MKHITDSVHGGILIEDQFILDLIKTKEFKRLSRISHLGTTYMLYPMATHKRSEHSLGVYELARRALEKLKPEITQTTRRAILSAALLHDTGHGPLSHSFEKVSPVPHEEYTTRIMSGDSEVSEVYAKYDSESQKQAIQILEGKHELQWANQLISSELDVDRLDYLMRDSMNAGVNYGFVDINWLFKHIKIHEGELVWGEKALPAIEQMILARYQMGQSVYRSENSNAYNQLYIYFVNRLRYLKNKDLLKGDYDLFTPIIEDRKLTVSEFYQNDDITFIAAVKKAMLEEEDELIKKIAKMFIEEKKPNIIKNPTTEYISELNQEEKGMSWSVVSLEKDIRTHKAQDKSEAKIITEDNTVIPVTKASSIFANIAKSNEEIKKKTIVVEI